MWELFYNKKLTFKQTIKPLIKTLLWTLGIRKITKVSKGIVIMDHWSCAFFHWFGDVLQKLEAMEACGLETTDYLLVVPYKFDTTFSRYTLSKYNIKALFLSKNKVVKVENALYIPQITPSGNYRPELMKSIRKRFRAQVGSKIEGKRVYITRSKAPKRTIANEDKLIPILKKHNFVIAAMEDLSFEEQLELIAQSNMLISLHGAGLTHMLWLPENSKVMEIRLKNDSINNCYFSLASDLNLKYFYALATATDENKPTQLTDFVVDVEEFEKTLIFMIDS